MQLKTKLSLVACLFALSSTNVKAQDYVSVQYLQYNENNSRVGVSAPSIEVNKDFGTDYTLNASLVYDGVSGASPTYVDSISGASAYSRGAVSQNDVSYQNVNFNEGRVALSTMLTTRFESRDELQMGIGYSAESDFYSLDLSAGYLHYLDSSHNSSVNFGASFQANQILIKDCNNNSDCTDTTSGASEKMTSSAINIEAGFTQVLDKTSLVKASLFFSNESGYLSNNYMNVVRNYNTSPIITNDARPDKRVGYGVNLKYIKSLSESLTTQIGYRFYSDDWDITSHTIDSILSYNVASNLVLDFGLRYYTQSKASFYNKAKDFFTNEEFASSDERVSSFNAIKYKIGAVYKLTKDMKVNLNASFYDQNTGLSATYFTTGLKYEF